jgi:NADPH:quinone reductase-like Zn-dependent oxidoreductase
MKTIDRPVAEPGEGEVRVRILASSINPVHLGLHAVARRTRHPDACSTTSASRSVSGPSST